MLLFFSVSSQTWKMFNNLNQYNLLGARPPVSSTEDSWLIFNRIIQIVLKTKCLKTESKKTFYYWKKQLHLNHTFMCNQLNILSVTTKLLYTIRFFLFFFLWVLFALNPVCVAFHGIPFLRHCCMFTFSFKYTNYANKGGWSISVGFWQNVGPISQTI